jgi:hypothetical protein
MVIPDTLFKQWEVLFSPGDGEKIAALAKPPISGETVRRAMRFKRCSDEVFKLICFYYEEKASMIIDETNNPILQEANKFIENAAQQVD